MRDFLLRAYQVRTTQIRSCVMHTKISRQGNWRAVIPKPHRWFRHRSTKKMVVQMTEGFVWPEEIPESQLEESFSKKTYHEGEKEGRLEQVGRQPDRVMRPKVREMRMLEEQAKDLLRGRERWRPSWVEYGYGVKPLGAEEGVGRS
jgi:large subunit ribosomal protein L23